MDEQTQSELAADTLDPDEDTEAEADLGDAKVDAFTIKAVDPSD